MMLLRMASSEHCRRVARWASAHAGTSGGVLEKVAQFHHFPALLLDDGARRRLLLALGFEEMGASMLSDDVREVLVAYHGLGGSPEARNLARYLELAERFDAELEGEALDLPTDEEASGPILRALNRAHEIRSRELMERLPPFPKAARRAVWIASNPESTLEDFLAVVSSDPVIAAKVLSFANSALQGTRQPIRSLDRALMQIGLDAARRIVLAVAVRPLFASAALKGLWEHSVEMASRLRAATLETRVQDPLEAFLAGLVHDIGRLGLQFVSREGRSLLEGLVEDGCAVTTAERLVFGRDHAGLGAEMLAHWEFPEDLVEQVRRHHSPRGSESRGAALLYLMEEELFADEQPPSLVQRQAVQELIPGVASKLRAAVGDSCDAALKIAV